ncbi:hypothetical protein V8G54_013240, partial [Vigna mungo]
MGKKVYHVEYGNAAFWSPKQLANIKSQTNFLSVCHDLGQVIPHKVVIEPDLQSHPNSFHHQIFGFQLLPLVMGIGSSFLPASKVPIESPLPQLVLHSHQGIKNLYPRQLNPLPQLVLHSHPGIKNLYPQQLNPLP